MKVLLAEDTTDLNRAVTAVLTRYGYEVDAAFDGEEALSFLREKAYDAVILDIMMPKLSGLEVLKEMRRSNIMTPVLLLTAKAEVDDRVEGLDAGADDYLTKPFAMKELMARLRALTRRQETYEAAELSFADLSLNADSFEMVARNAVRLSIKEFELMQTLLRNVDRELSTEYILEHIWKHETDAGEATVWLYISYLKGKLRAVNSVVDITGESGGSFRLVEKE